VPKTALVYRIVDISFGNGYLFFFLFPYKNLKHDVLLTNSESLLYKIPPPHGATAPSGPGPPHYRFFTFTFRHNILGRTPLAEWSEFMIYKLEFICIS